MKQINAGGIVLTGFILTGANVDFTSDAGPSFFTSTFKTTDFIFTTCSIETRIRSTIVDVCFASKSCETFSAMTNKLIVQVDATLGTNGTARIAQALVDFGFALKTNETRSTLA